MAVMLLYQMWSGTELHHHSLIPVWPGAVSWSARSPLARSVIAQLCFTRVSLVTPTADCRAHESGRQAVPALCTWHPSQDIRPLSLADDSAVSWKVWHYIHS